MSTTLTNLAIATLSSALDKLDAVFDTAADELFQSVLDWKTADVDPAALDSELQSNAIHNLRSIAKTKLDLARLIRTRPAVLPPRFVERPTLSPMLTDVFVMLGDAETSSEIGDAVAYLMHSLKGTTWDVNGAPTTTQLPEAADDLGSTNDVGEVSPGPAEEP
jgi:hypothetical protein